MQQNRNLRSPPPPPRVLAVDVDGTLINRDGIENLHVTRFCREQKARGMFLMLWSSRGKEYAEGVANRLGLVDLFDLILSKPGYVVDDQGWGWTQYTQVLNNPLFNARYLDEITGNGLAPENSLTGQWIKGWGDGR